MTQVVYSIKEAAEELGVETHALRYWEEELELSIERSAQGRRIYSEEDMTRFRQIMEWKRQGFQLKMIKELIHGEDRKVEGLDMGRRIIMYRPREVQSKETLEVPPESDLAREEKARRLQELLKQFISESIRESNTELLGLLKEGLLKELDYQFRLQEEREEEREKLRMEKEDEHFRLLDENIRNAMDKRGRKKKKGWSKL